MTPEKIHSLLARLAECSATPGRGVTRFSYSAADRRARDLVIARLAAGGCRAHVDWAGNIHALLPGRDPDLPAVMVGSHLDSVRNGGRFDGAVGVVGGLAALERMRGLGSPPRRSVRFVAFAEEEGSNFGIPLMGSTAFLGGISRDDMAGFRSGDGRTALDLMAAAGPFDDQAPDWAAPGNVMCMVELHIEQGPSLHETGDAIGVVDRIAADTVLTVEVVGRSGHSGAAAMRGRKDALAGAAGMVVACEALARSPRGEGAVVTVGRLDCFPNAFNCIPERVVFTIDIRHPDPEALPRVRKLAEERVRDIAADRGLEQSITAKHTPGVTLSPATRAVLERAAAASGSRWRVVPSWAMHDAGAVARVADAGMIFVPSRDGISHNQDEFTEAADIERGIDVLFAAVRELAGAGV